MTGEGELDVAGFELLALKIAADSGFRCDAYKPRCLQRRIAVRMRARAVHTYADYARVLDSDPHEYERLLDALTINVTKFFRNWETYEAIGRLVVPALFALPDSQVRIWSAGCASGEEPYSVATLLLEHARVTGAPDATARMTVLGTDIDVASLRTGGIGRYPDAAFADTPAELRERWFGPPPGGEVSAAARAMVRFERRDLLAASAPDGPHHLVLCRNVLIYFDRRAQDRLIRGFHDALAPGGLLVLGKVESLIGDLRELFVTVDSRQRIYRRRA